MSQGVFVRTLVGIDGRPVAVKVVESDISHAESWDRNIQAPWVAQSGRIDALWNWRRNYLRAALLETAAGRHLAYLRVITPDAKDQAFPLGQVLLADGYPYPPSRRLPCIFLWYLAAAPKAAVAAAGAHPCTDMLAALVDVAVQFSYIRGYQGRLCLHASPEGTQAQQSELANRYNKLGLQTLKGRWFAGWGRRNDGRYFFADEQVAMNVTAQFDSFR
jgi:hypothetical protein